MTIFSSTGLAKTYNDRLLFTSVSFGMEEGERVGIIGKNGAGKTTLMKIIAGLVEPDEGEVIFNNSASLEFLDQLPEFDRNEVVLDAVMKARQEMFDYLNEYRELCSLKGSDQDRIQWLMNKIDTGDGWNLEPEAKKILTMLGIKDLYQDVTTLSGGLRKRVALARALLSKPTLLILDEPTNHLDADSVQWLQDYLMNSSQSIMFVTHDRYFLDSITTRIVEIDKQRIFNYPGNYQTYLEQKEAFTKAEEATVTHKLTRLRTELAWLQKGAKARRSKQKSRIDWIEELRKSAKRTKEKKIKIELGKTFLGSRIIDAHSITKSIGGKLLFNDFTYIAKPKDRIGIIGPNGSGKTTLLNVLCGRDKADDGTVKLGASINFGFFEQEVRDLRPRDSVIGSLRQVADYIDVGVGRDRYLTTKDLLEKFLFPAKQQSALIETLSGGEKRRLALLRVLMANPNVLLLDEPTNDFDIQTLNALENYLDDFYGTLIIVSHDRSFLDRTVEFIFAFDGNGNIKEYPGNYSAYLEKKEIEKREAARLKAEFKPEKKQREKNSVSKKLTYKEKRELEMLEKELPALEERKAGIEKELANCPPEKYQQMEQLSNQLDEISDELDEKTLRWLELDEKAEMLKG